MAFSGKLKATILSSFMTVVGGGVILDAGDSAAAQCLLSNLNSCNQTTGDLTFSDFNFSGFTADSLDYFDVSSDGISGTVTLNFVPLQRASISTGTFGYTVSLSGRNFNSAEAFLTGSTLGGASYSTTFKSSGLSVSATARNGASPGTVRAFDSLLTSQMFTQDFVFRTSASGNLSTVGASFDTTQATSVPGPLPILGAGAAFGFSRKLRKRIKQAA